MWEKSSQFWGSRNAFRSATVAKQGGKSSTIVTPSGRFSIPSLESMESRWNTRMQRDYLGLKYGITNATMKLVVDGATPLVRRLLTRIAPALTEAYDRELGTVANNALNGWPVSSGYSKSAITLGYANAGEFEFIGSVGNQAPYAIFIKGSPWNKLIRQPTKQAASNIAASLRIGA
jgi:hypothetical protein